MRGIAMGGRVRTEWLEGIGLHTGAPCRVRVLLAPAGTGLRFRRVDLDGATIAVRPSSIVETDRRVVLEGERGARVATVEHLLAALHGLGLWDAVIEVEGPELPALDGSALPFARALVPLREEAPLSPWPARLRRAVVIARDGSRAEASPSSSLTVSCRVRFDHPAVGDQRASWRGSPAGFLRGIAPARTFGFLSDVEPLHGRGLALGGSLDNALAYDERGPLAPERLPREPARHKLLDALGDLALLGRPVAAKIRLDRPGHGTTSALVRAISEVVTRRDRSR